ncbi:MarR family winged helix-turn-helix transcriptional regulator [Pelagibius sp. Alg239-R121]|uniref:MarR family winged helix-turn-helix transcriptional regulator n=1 Tax=Pelagibius sp. Alg239-R121 TaxID=2993448 RepID=UPI0024A6F95C|nr:MarR family transcriptional regulator [Pelagibius sp. Alg239-R121]
MKQQKDEPQRDQTQDGVQVQAMNQALGASMDAILAQWQRERPDLDSAVMAICGDVWRAGERLRQGVTGNLSASGLDIAGFDVLLTLRRQGRDEALSPSALAKDMMLSTSAMTNRLDRLEKRGLIKRQTDPGDRRGLKIVLSEEGFRLADELVASHVQTEERMLGALSQEERDQLRELLSRIG